MRQYSLRQHGTSLYLYIAIADDSFWRSEAERQIAMIQAEIAQDAST